MPGGLFISSSPGGEECKSSIKTPCKHLSTYTTLQVAASMIVMTIATVPKVKKISLGLYLVGIVLFRFVI